MRIISCHIDNFGKLSNIDMNFEEGLNTLIFENGWGKSTLAAFIKSMFYGFLGENKKKILENERKKYKPWQGGVFGGSITFDVAGKTYVLTRIFMEKETDFFELRDKNTNLVSKDYSESIGVELFGLDGASFMRTVFIGQNDSVTYATDDINAKVGKLLDDSDDLRNYENAVKLLSDRINALNPRRVTGSLSKRKNEISKHERLVKDGNGIKESISELEKKEANDRGRLEEIKKALSDNKSLQKRFLELKALGTIEREWVRLKEIVRQREDAGIKLKEGFNSKVPSMSEIDDILDLSQELNRREAERDACMVDASVGDRLKSELNDKMKRASSYFVTLVGIVLMVSGAVLAFLGISKDNNALFFAGLGVAAVALILIALHTFKKRELKSSCSTLEKELEDHSKKVTIYQGVDRECSGLRKKIEEFFTEYGFEAEKNVNLQLLRIRDKVDDYLDSKESTEEAVRQLKEFEEVHEQEIWKINDGYGLGMDSDGKDFRNLENDEINRRLDNLNVKNEALEKELQVCWNNIKAYSEQLAQLREKLDEWEENNETLRELKIVQSEERKEYDRISAAKTALEKAKENMTSRYVGPILKSFRNYYSILTGNDPSAFKIDADTKITVEEQGIQRDTELLSNGYKDLIGVALRVSLADAMYHDELPLLIMDDPFVNLDDSKIEKIPHFLSVVSEKYQVLYFTCSKMRT